MREKVALLLIVGVALATSAFSAQQRTCTAPVPSVSKSSPTDDGDTWTGEPSFYQKAIWRIEH